ncbi:quinone oxidoreductase family protein [Amycolatopsis jejuensis]|uniref:quinone oxidoreductase family protein n=1 Tax=Amycolatopsis jejuensis TaxID=330084 RepID=UPI000525AD59|nr:zinc-binding dehydrogenase [Amycolatopsis jejuensis]
MKAVEIAAFGGPENLKTVKRPTPVPSPGQALVAVEAIGVGLADVLTRKGVAGVAPGAVPGIEVVGTVTAVSADQDSAWVGRRVFAMDEHLGGYAEQVVTEVSALAAVPDSVTPVDAIGIGISSLVAEYTLDRAAVSAGDQVLVRGASGGIGVMAVQLAAARGATVVAGTTTADDDTRLTELGATHIVDAQGVARDGRTFGYDAVVDIVAGAGVPDFVGMLRENGRYVVCGIAGGLPPAEFGMSLLAAFQRSLTISTLSLNSHPGDGRAAVFETLLGKAAQGTIRPLIHDTMKLDEAAAAHTRLESGSVFGKIVLTP